jgi:hypothetical protein
MDDFLPSSPPATDSGSMGEHKIVPAAPVEEQMALDFGHGEV